MSNLTVTTRFTKNSGQPATGLTLAQINLYLTSIDKATGVVANVWNPQNPTVEAGLGSYLRIYDAANFDAYDYIARAEYTGVTVLDTNYAYNDAFFSPADCDSIGPSLIEWTYPVTSSTTGLPIEGVEVWFYSDVGVSNLVWYGVTDTFGVARNRGNLPRLDPGTYYVKTQKAGYVSDESVDVEVVA